MIVIPPDDGLRGNRRRQPRLRAVRRHHPPVVASFTGSSDHVVTSPTITTALITSAVLIPFPSQENYPEYVFVSLQAKMYQ